MAIPELAIDTASVILRGLFDVTVLSPQNLAEQGLIDPGQLADATQKFSTNEISIFETKRIRFVCNQQVLQFTAQQADEFEPLRDLALGALRLLPAPQVSVLGINRDVHFAVLSDAAWHAVGDTLAPKYIWEDLVKFPGMASLAIQGQRPGKYAGFSQITIAPSNIVTQAVFVGHNDHYSLEVLDKIPHNAVQFGASLKQVPEISPEKVPIAINILNEEWDSSMARSVAVIDRVAQQARR
jgi:hypothetical protein